MTFAIGPVIAAAQLAATVAAADDTAGPCVIHLYANTQPAMGAAAGADPLVSITLAKPCATLAAGVFTLHPAEVQGALVLTPGVPRWGRWERSDGVLVADGTVTDVDNGGDFQVAGAPTAPGDTSPSLYAGGRVLLGETTLT